MPIPDEPDLSVVPVMTIRGFNDMMNAKHIPSLGILIVFTIVISCSIIHHRPEINPVTEQCTHCHGDRLQGIRNTRDTCGACHDLKPISPEEVQNKEMKEAITTGPHIHTTKNLFSGTPSCFNCHRWDAIQ
jgi:hypothetical protein